jgi:hypothetical protein
MEMQRPAMEMQVAQVQHAQPVELRRQAGHGDGVAREVHACRGGNAAEQGDAMPGDGQSPVVAASRNVARVRWRSRRSGVNALRAVRWGWKIKSHG